MRSRLSIATTSISVQNQSLLAASADSASSSTSGASNFTPKAHYSKVDLSVSGMTLKIMREEGGVRGLYRGILTTAMGVAPYVGINFATYEALRGIITPPGQSSVTKKLICGALAGMESFVLVFCCAQRACSLGSISQTLTFPFDVLRRKMQVVGMSAGGMGYRYNGAIDALGTIIRTEGLGGLYRGIWPNLRESIIYYRNMPADARLNNRITVKVAPSIAMSFFTYELVKELLIAPS